MAEMTKQTPRRRGPMGHGPMMAGEKPKDFKGSASKLIKYMAQFRFRIIAVIIFAIGGTVFNILGPKILGHATDELFDGLVAK